MESNFKGFAKVFFFVSLLTGLLAIVSFWFALADSEGGMEDWPLTVKFFKAVFYCLFEYPLFQSFELLGLEEHINDHFLTLILLNILLVSLFLTILIWQYKQKKFNLIK